jgi:copper transporter 1
MLWNWNTIDACFVSRSWHITSRGMFAGSCIGVILLVILLEFLRRAGKEYDRYLVAQHTRSVGSSDSLSSSSSTAAVADATKGPNSSDRAAACNPVVSQPFRPNVMQQAIRALLHMLQFAVAYFVMLLAMYYNGYIIICIFIGAYLGYFIFGWETLNAKVNGRMQEEVTVCCG